MKLTVVNLDKPGSRGRGTGVISWCLFSLLSHSSLPFLSSSGLFLPFSPFSTSSSLPFATSPSFLFSYLLSHSHPPTLFPLSFSLLPPSSPFISSFLPHPSPALPLRFLCYCTRHLCTWCSEEHQDQRHVLLKGPYNLVGAKRHRNCLK